MMKSKRKLFAIGGVVALALILGAAGSTTYKTMTVPSGTPTGAAGAAIKTNFTTLVDRAGSYLEVAGIPGATDDDANGAGHGYCYENTVWKNTDTNRLYWCVDSTASGAVWREMATGAFQVETVPPESTIQAIIDDVTDATASKPYVVVVPPGVYTEQITMKDYVSLQGSGISVTKITHAGANADGRGTIIPADEVTISNMTIEGTGSNENVGISTYEVAGCANITFRVRGCHIDADWDLIYLDQDGIICEVYDCTGVHTFDGYTITKDAPASDCTAKMYIYNCRVTATVASNISHGVYAWTDCASAEIYVFNPVLVATTTVTGGLQMAFGSDGLVRIYNPDVTYTGNTTADIYGALPVVSSGGEIEIHGGRFNVTNSGAGDGFDISGVGGTTNVYGTRYATSSGTIGGYTSVAGVGITSTDACSFGAVTGTSFTDGTTTVTAGNYTGVGNITGTDIDVSAGTGTYTTTGDCALGYLNIPDKAAGNVLAQFGDGSPSSTDPAVVLKRATSPTASAHGFVDESIYTLAAGLAFNSFDARGETAGIANHDHIANFQANNVHGSTGTLTAYSCYSSTPEMKTGAGAVTHVYGVKANNADNNSVAIENQYGVYVGDLDAATHNWGVYVAGADKNYLGSGLGLGIATPDEWMHIRPATTDEKGNLLLQTKTSTIGQWAGVLFRLSSVSGNTNYEYGGVLFERLGANGVGAVHLCAVDDVGGASVTPSDAVLTASYTGVVTVTGDLDVTGTLDVGTSASTALVNVTSVATDATLVTLNGYTTDYTGTDPVYSIYAQRDLSQTALTDAYGIYNELQIDGTPNVTAGKSLYGSRNTIDNNATVTNATASDYNLNFYGNYVSLDDDSTWDTSSTGRNTIYNYGSYNNCDVDTTFTDTGGNTPATGLRTYGTYNRVTTTPTLTSGALTAISYGEYISVTGNTVGTSTNYGIYIATVTGADTNYSIWDASGADWTLDADNQLIRLGATQGDFDLYSDGTDGQLDASADIDIHPATKTTLGDGGTTNYASFANDGSLSFAGTAGLVIPSGTDLPSGSVGELFLDTDAGTNGTIYCYSNSAWRVVVALP